MCTRYSYLRSLCCVLYFYDVEFDTVCRLEHFSLHLFVLSKNCIYFTKIHTDVLAVISLNNTCHNILLTAIIFIVQRFSLFFTDLLHNDLFGFLCSNTSEVLRYDLHMNNITRIIKFILQSCIGNADLHLRIFYFFHYCLVCKDFDFTGLTIHCHTDIVCFAVFILTGSNKRILNGFKQNIFADAFLFFYIIQCFD